MQKLCRGGMHDKHGPVIFERAEAGVRFADGDGDGDGDVDDGRGQVLELGEGEKNLLFPATKVRGPVPCLRAGMHAYPKRDFLSIACEGRTA